jgi:B12-binding domain/radical SAM domain protein
VPAYDFLLHAVFKYRSLGDFLPYLEWLRYPSTMLLNSRGCALDCAICGGSSSAYSTVVSRPGPAMRSPAKLVADARVIASFSGAPIFVVHDLRVGGDERAAEFLTQFAAADIDNELVIEVFTPADRDFFGAVREATRAWSLQLTIESADPEIRRVNGKFGVSNAEVEATLEAALAEGCGKVDLFFMVGLSGQDHASAMSTVDYCRQLVERFDGDRRLQFYVAPLGPFLDPGSRAHEHPEELGFHRRFSTLADHRQALLGPTWEDMLSFDTDWLSRREIVATTYEVGAALNDLKLEHGLIDAGTHAAVASHLQAAVTLLDDVRAAQDLPEPSRTAELTSLKHALESANSGTLVGVDELKWKTPSGIRVTWALARRLARAVVVETGRARARYRCRYDRAIAHPVCRPVPRPASTLVDVVIGSRLQAEVLDAAGTAAGAAVLRR